MPYRPLRAQAVDRVIQAVDVAVPRGRGVVLHSSPDLDDNVVALLRQRPADASVTVLVGDVDRATARARALGVLEGVRLVRRHSPAGWWAYLRSRVTVTSHGLFGCLRRGPGKLVIGLWHGEFGKQIGQLAGEGRRHFDWAPVSSPLSRGWRSAEFGLRPERIHVVGVPRQASLTSPAPLPADAPGTRHLVWVPTYRTSVTGDVRTDGDPAALDRAVAEALQRLEPTLERLDVTVWYRPHPMAAQELPGVGARVRRATNDDLEPLGLTFYDLLGRADLLVTDYSSVWIDFLLRGRPLIAFCPDLEVYRRDRGLALEPHDAWFPGPVVEDVAALVEAVEHALAQPEPDATTRRARAQLHADGLRPVDALWAAAGHRA